MADKSKAELQALADRHPVRKDFYSEMDPAGFTTSAVAAAEERLAKCVERVEKTLSAPGHTGPWLMGDQFTIADACLMPVIDRMNDMGMSATWENGKAPGVARWYAEIQKRPAFAATYYEGTRLSENYGAPRNR